MLQRSRTSRRLQMTRQRGYTRAVKCVQYAIVVTYMGAKSAAELVVGDARPDRACWRQVVRYTDALVVCRYCASVHKPCFLSRHL